MSRVDIYYQREGATEIEHIEIESTATFFVLKEELRKKHGITEEVLMFVEDAEEPCGDNALVEICIGSAGGKVHVHRCRHVHVSVTYNNETGERRFAPGATIAHVKHWAAVKHFGLSPEDAGEHVLQIKGTTERPGAGAHIGALVKSPECRIAFDLVPDERIHGASGV